MKTQNTVEVFQYKNNSIISFSQLDYLHKAAENTQILQNSNQVSAGSSMAKEQP